jgi:hypothetical protein
VVEWSGEWRGWLGFKLPRSVSALLCCVCSSSRSRGVLWCDTGGSPHLSLSPRERKKDRKERMETKRGPCLRGSGSTVRLNKGNGLSFIDSTILKNGL